MRWRTALVVSASLAMTATPSAWPSAQAQAKGNPPAAPVLEGLVRGPDRKPIEKALVAAIADGRGSQVAPARTRTDAAGRFRLELRTRERHSVRVEAPGLAPATRKGAVPGVPLTFDLTAGGTIEGTVRDEAGQPVGDIRVSARQTTGMAVPSDEPGAGIVATRTDAQGRFTLRGLADGRHDLLAGGRGRGAGRRHGVRANGRVEIVVFPSGSIFGTVLGADGRPVPGATVAAAPGWQAAPAEPVDARGAFEIHALSPGAYDVVALAPGMAPAVASGVTIDNRTDAPVALVLLPGARVAGRLLGDEGRPAAGRVALAEIDGQRLRGVLAGRFAAEAGSDGRFVIEGVPTGEHAVAVDARGFGRRRVALTVRASDRQVDVGDVRLEAGLAISGRVRSKAGAPVADARVSAVGARGGDEPVEVLTEADGTFTLAGLEDGPYRVVAEAAGHTFAETTAEAGRKQLVLVLKPVGTIVGRAVDDRGQPLDGVRASADTGGDFEAGRQFAESEASVGEGGGFRLSDLPAGTYAVTIAAPERLSATLPAVVVAEGQTADVGTVRLESGGVVRGTVVDADGDGVAGASIVFTMDERARAATGGSGGDVVTDAAGSFELKGLAPASVKLGAYHPGYAPSGQVTVEVDPARPATDVRLVLQRGARIEGSVKSRDGSGRPGIVVTASPRAARQPFVMLPSALARAVTTSDGTFVVEHVPAGRVSVSAYSPASGSLGDARDVEVRDGETTEVDFVDQAILLSGRVTRSGAPGAGIRLDASPMTNGVRTIIRGAPAAGIQRLTAVTREDGSFEMLLNQAGPHFVEAEARDGARLGGRGIDVPEADAHAVELAFDSVAVTGVVVDAAGAPAPHAVVRASREGRQLGGTNAGADGRFRFELEPGEYELSASPRGGDAQGPGLTATVGPSGLSDVRLEIQSGATIAGTVRRADGSPAVGVSVQAAAGSRSPGGHARTRADGSFEITGLEDGAYTVTAQDAVGGFARQRDVRSGSRATLSLRAGGRLTVTATTAEGAPVAGAMAMVTHVDGEPAGLGSPSAEATDAQGRVVLDAPAGALTVLVHETGQAIRLRGTAPVTLSSGGTAAVAVELREGGPQP